MRPTAPAPKSDIPPSSQKMLNACIVGGCEHPPSGAGGGRMKANLANFCACHARYLVEMFPLPGDDGVVLGVCSDGS